MAEQAYLFDPVGPLVLRTGRPFDQAGDPVSLAFPLPSTLAGACRTMIADANSWDFREKYTDLKNIAIRGPLAAAIDSSGVNPLFPRPADALYIQEKNAARASLLRLRPQKIRDDEIADLPHDGLWPVFPEKRVQAKPTNGDNWWKAEHFLSWLRCEKPAEDDPCKLGWAGPEQGLRTHVAIDPGTLSAEDGKLFQTEGLDFGPGRKDMDGFQGWTGDRHGILVRVPEQAISDTVCHLGGEGRLCRVSGVQDWPVADRKLADALAGARGIRMILVTPALFSGGWKPDWLDQELCGTPPGFADVRLQLRGFVCHRWQPVSGWNLQKKQPRAVRRMIPAGSVYWFEVLEGKVDVEKTWLQPVSDDKQECLNGFGLAVTGIWER